MDASCLVFERFLSFGIRLEKAPLLTQAALPRPLLILKPAQAVRTLSFWKESGINIIPRDGNGDAYEDYAENSFASVVSSFTGEPESG